MVLVAEALDLSLLWTGQSSVVANELKYNILELE